MKLFCLVAALCAVAIFEANCVSIDSIKEATKTIAEKAADKADQVEPAEEKGGVRATIMHTGINMALDKGMDALGKRYPVVALATPVAKKLAKPLVAAAHNTINNWSEARKNKTGEAVTEQPAAEPTTVAGKPAKEEKKAATPEAETTTTPKPEAVQKKADKKAAKKDPKKKEEKEKADKKEKKKDKKEEKVAEDAKEEKKTDQKDDDKTPEKEEVKEVAEKVDEKTEEKVEDSTTVDEKDENRKEKKDKKNKKKDKKEKSEKEVEEEEKE